MSKEATSSQRGAVLSVRSSVVDVRFKQYSPSIDSVLRAGAAKKAARERSEATEVYVFHNRPRFGIFYEPVGHRLLPSDHTWQSMIATLPWPTKNQPEVIATMAFAAFIRSYFQACAESLASENASRLAAMQRAEKNLEGTLNDLTRFFHRTRQSPLTKSCSM